MQVAVGDLPFVKERISSHFLAFQDKEYYGCEIDVSGKGPSFGNQDPTFVSYR